MRRIFTALTLAAALPLCAQDVAAPRFAFFNLGQLVESSVKAKRVVTELEVTGKNLQDKIDAKVNEGQKLQQQLQSGALSDQGKEQLQKQLRDLDYELKKLQEDSQAEITKVRTRVMKQLSDLVVPYIEAVAKEQKLQVVFNGDQTGLAWADGDWIKGFTGEVAKRLDASEGAAAPKASDKPAAKPAGKK